MLNRLFVTAMVLFVCFTASATDLLVPQQYATIQAAINAAVTGDSVLIAPGIYNEALTITGKAITVRSTGTASTTTIDRVNAGGAVFTIRDVLTGSVVFTGITIKRCTGNAIDVAGATVNLQNVRVLSGSRAVWIGANGIVNATDFQVLFMNGGTGAGCYATDASSRFNGTDCSFQGISGGNGNCITASAGSIVTLVDAQFLFNSGGSGCVGVNDASSLVADGCRWQGGVYSSGSVAYVSGAGNLQILNSVFVGQTGGAVWSGDGTILIDGVQQTGNLGSVQGSLLYAAAGSVVVKNVVSANSQSSLPINSGGGWIWIDTAACLVDGCAVSGQFMSAPTIPYGVSTSFGGSILIAGAGQEVEVRNTSFATGSLAVSSEYSASTNERRVEGRAIATRSRNLRVLECTFSGGATSANSSWCVVNIASEVFTDAGTLTLEDCQFDGIAGMGAGVRAKASANAVIKRSEFKRIANLGLAVDSGGDVLVEESSFQACSRGIERTAAGPLSISRCRFFQNWSGGGSAIQCALVPPTVTSCFFSGNTAPAIHLGGGQNYVLLSNSSFCGTQESEVYRYIVEKGENFFNVDCAQDCDLDGAPNAYEIGAGLETDCNANGIPDSCDVDQGGADCNSNGIPDLCDISGGSASDCNSNGVPDSCEPDCDADGIPNTCEITSGASDCDLNGIPDTCQADCDSDGVIDACEIAKGSSDCNANGIPDACEIASGAAMDFNLDDVIDSCQPDMQFAGLELEIVPIINRGTDDLFPSSAVCYRLYAKTTLAGAAVLGMFGNMEHPISIAAKGGFWQSPAGADLASAIPCDLSTALPSARFDSWFTIGRSCASGNSAQNTGLDLAAFNAGGEVDDDDGIVFVAPSATQSIAGAAKRVLLAQLTTASAVLPSGFVDVVGLPATGDGEWLAFSQPIPAPSLTDCDGNGQQDAFDIALGVLRDCDQSGVPDICEFPSASTDCNLNGIPDLCDVVSAFSSDVNTNFVPDECECSGDIDANGRVDVDDIIDVITSWGASGASAADVNSDGIVDAADLVIVLAGYGICL
jgi:hypothetical protein